MSHVTAAKTFIGANAYACLTLDQGGKFDIRLDPGMSAAAALERYAAEQESRARDAMQRAEWARQGAAMLAAKSAA